MLTDRIALVTGTDRGIGEEMAKTLARGGAVMIVNYNGSAAKAEETVAEIVAIGGKTEAVQCDASDLGKSRKLMDCVVKTCGKLDILVNNAGTTKDGLLMKMSEADFDAVININLKGVSSCMQHVVHQMIKQKGGRIINITSVVGVMGNTGQANYATSKTGIIGITESAARKMVSRGTTVNAIVPGSIVVEMADVLSDTVKDAMKQQIPTKAFGETSNMAETAAFLVSEKTRYITGQAISADSGMVM